MRWDASSVMYPGFIECFRPHNNILPRPGDLARADQVRTCVPVALNHGSALLKHSHLEALFAGFVAVLIAVLLSGSLMPNRV